MYTTLIYRTLSGFEPATLRLRNEWSTTMLANRLARMSVYNCLYVYYLLSLTYTMAKYCNPRFSLAEKETLLTCSFRYPTQQFPERYHPHVQKSTKTLISFSQKQLLATR